MSVNVRAGDQYRKETYTSHSTAELRKASFSKAAFWLAVVELRCSFVMLSCRAGNGLSVEADLTRLMSGVDCAEDGRSAGGGRSVDELVFDCMVSLSSGVRGRGNDSPTGTSVCLLLKEPREGADEVDDA